MKSNINVRRITPRRRKMSAPPPSIYILSYLENGKATWGCRKCDWAMEAGSDAAIEHCCGGETNVRFGWGDMVESALLTVGVTKERWNNFKATFGLPSTCNCDARREALNRIGHELGDLAKNAVANLLGENKNG